MTAKRPAKLPAATRVRPPSTVEEFFAGISHPLTPTLRAVCAAILSASPAVVEGVKWNAPSFHVGEQYFATANIHARGKTGETVLLVLHRGAKAKPGRVKVDDPEGLIEWLAADRGTVRFHSEVEVRLRASALQAVVRQWITQL